MMQKAIIDGLYRVISVVIAKMITLEVVSMILCMNGVSTDEGARG